MNQPKDIIIFSNGNVGAFDANGEQIGELQESWMGLLFDKWEAQGVDISKISTIETVVNGEPRYLKPTKREDGSWQVTFSHF